MSATLCSHCLLPISGPAQARTVDGQAERFCCYGCALAFQVHHGHGEEAEATWLLLRLGIGAFLAMNIMLFSLLLYSGDLAAPRDAEMVLTVHIILWLLATPALFILGGPFVVAAVRALRPWHKARVTSDSLVALGALAAYGYSTIAMLLGQQEVYFDTAIMVLLLFTIGRYLEAVGRARAMRDLAPLLGPERVEAHVVVNGQERTLPASMVAPGTAVRVRPGERVPVDGVVIEGRSQCDESVLTGEAHTQTKAPGTRVYAGSVNGSGQLLVTARAVASGTRWGRIARRVRAALSEKSVFERLLDRVAAVFVPAVLLLATVALLYWSQQGPFAQAFMIGLAVLVVACPCALGLATPLATALGIAYVLRQGGLVRSGAVLEALANVRGVAFDKTGTLTCGAIKLVEIDLVDVAETELLARAAGLEQGSEHPLAQAITQAARARGIAPHPIQDIEAWAGQGVIGRLDQGVIAAGSIEFMYHLGFDLPAGLYAHTIERRPTQTIVYIGWHGRVRGALLLQDRPRPEARRVVTRLRKLGLNICLLSGDNPATVACIASAVGINNCKGGLSPAGKIAALDNWARKRGMVAMVGDGLNDGPVLAAADVGIAVGGATDLAREAADLHLPGDDLSSLPWLVQLARRVRQTIIGNLMWAFAYNLVALTLAASGVLQPVLAAALMAGSSVFVVLNSLRLERFPHDLGDLHACVDTGE